MHRMNDLSRDMEGVKAFAERIKGDVGREVDARIKQIQTQMNGFVTQAQLSDAIEDMEVRITTIVRNDVNLRIELLDKKIDELKRTAD